MLVAIVGGKLQGVEAAYLARKAGWEVLLLDREAAVPASGLCDRFLQVDVTRSCEVGRLLDGVDFILPALEDSTALVALKKWSEASGIPIAFDPAAYAISSSKLESDLLFKKLQLPAPRPWPDCDFPVIVKPARDSGSHGVQVFHNLYNLSTALKTVYTNAQPVVQQYLQGPSYSIEVIGSDGKYLPLQVTDLHMDSVFDCKRVTAPSKLPAHLVAEFEAMAIVLANKLQLRGIMDVEVILHDGRLKLLEIDARLPSQTPTAVFWSTGINLVALLGELFTKGKVTAPVLLSKPRFVIYEHVRLTGSHIEIAGEHIVSRAGPLHVESGFFGADEGLTNICKGRSDWVATLVFAGETAKEVWLKKLETLNQICKHTNLSKIVDFSPDKDEKKGEGGRSIN